MVEFEEFKGESLINFMDKFKTDEDCLHYLKHYKWKDGFICSKCGHSHFWTTSNKTFHRTCKACRHCESVTSNTFFHKLKFSIRKAFYMAFDITCSTKGMSAEALARKYEVNRKTALLFTKKMRTVMKSSESFPLTGSCEVDEAVIGGKKEGKRGRGAIGKKKISVVIEKNNKGITRAYCEKIKDFSSTELSKIFTRHISKGAQVTTDEWTGYLPIMKDWNITQQKSKPAQNFTLMHRFIQQLKAWLRGIHHHVSEKHLQGYLDEFCYRFNRHCFRDSIFDGFIQRTMKHKPISNNLSVSQ